MQKALSFLGFMLVSSLAFGQFVVPFSGTDTSNACTGTLYDHGGPTGNYSNSANGMFFITPAGSSLSMTFTSFQLESCCDYVRIYDGIGTTGTLLLSANGSALPNGGSPIVAPSGVATVRFTSDYSVTGSGFAMNWTSAGGTSTPSVAFSPSTLNPPLNFPISFTNSSSVGDYAWTFGDGGTSTDKDPVHTYSTPGTYTVQLSVTTCGGGTASSSQTVVVQNAPSYTLSPDSIYASVSCGGLAQGSFTIANDSSGTLGFNLTNYEVPASNPFVLQEDFESGLGAFTVSPSATIGFSAGSLSGAAASGSHYLYLNGYTGIYDGVTSSFPASQPTSFTYYVSVPYTSAYLGRTYLVADPSNPSLSQLYSSYIRYGYLYVQTSISTYYYALNTTGWNYVEVLNINYTTKTFDLRINGATVATNLTFYTSTLNQVAGLLISNTSSGAGIGFDKIELRDDAVPQPLTLSQTTGLLGAGNTKTVSASISTLGMAAGRYHFEVAIHSNSTGSDSLKTVPFIVDISGTAALDLDKNCLNYGSLYTALAKTDSIEIINSGCDTLNVSGITSTNADFVLSASSFVVHPFDTAYLKVTFNPNSVGTYTDTLYWTTNIGDTTVCLNGTGLASAIAQTDSSAYHLYTIGCADSAHFNMSIYNPGQTNLNWNWTSRTILQDDFNGATTSSIWQSLGTNLIGSHCYNRSGNSLSMYGSNRMAVTVPFTSSGSDTVAFWARPGYALSPCDQPDASEYLYVQYSTNGISWYTLGTVYYFTSTPTRYSYLIPVSGQVQVRFYQTYYTTTTDDNYLIDDFEVLGTSNVFGFNPTSGTTNTGDTSVVQGSLYTGDLVSGTYSYTLSLHSNDPSSSSLSIPVTLTIAGEPIMALDNSTCIDFGTVVNGNILSDSVLVWNEGCDTLTFSGVTSSNTEFNGVMSSNAIAAGDSAYLRITYNSVTAGTFADTLFLQSNDTTGVVCLSAIGIGAPNFAVTPDSIYVSTNSCDDSLFVNLNVTNTGGLSTLTYQMDSIRGSQATTINVTVLRSYSDVSREYPNTMLAFSNYLPGAVLLESNATSAAGLTADLVNAQVLLIPEQELMGITQAYTYAPAIQAFLNRGGSVVMCGNTASLLGAFGIVTYNSNSSTSGGVITVPDPSHPVFAGMNASAFYCYSATIFMNITNPGVENLAYYSNTYNNVVSVHPWGAGKVGYFGFDFYNYDNETLRGLANMVAYVAPNTGVVDWGYLTNDSASVPTGGASQTGVHLLSRGLTNGRHLGFIHVSTNDPANASVQIPVVFDVNGEAQMRLSGTCVEFDSLIVGLVKLDSTVVYNDGCDTLAITGSVSSTGDYSLNGSMPIRIAPGDSAIVEVAFAPSAMGNRNDTLWIQSANDTLPLCVLGDGLGAPQLSTQSDSLIVDLNKCDNFVMETFSLSNTGAGVLTYDIQFGEYFADTSYQTFNTTAATTIHTFNSTPTVADSIVVTIITSGDFDQSYEYYNLYVEGSYVASSSGSTCVFGQTDTLQYVFRNPSYALNTWLADGVLDVNVYNNSSVSYYSNVLNYVDVRVQIYNSSMPAWLTFPSVSTGTLAVGATDTKNLMFNGVIVPAGTYNVDMFILSNDPVQPKKVVPIIFNVLEVASVSLSDTCLSFPVTQVGDTTSATIWVINDGCIPLNVTSITSASNVFKVFPTSFSVPSKDSTMVTVKFIPSSITNYSSTITVNSSAGIETFCVNGTANAMPIASFQFGIIDACKGQVYFSDHSTRNPTSFSWEFGDGTISSLQNPIHDYDKPGTYAVKLTASNSFGWDTITQFVTVNPLYVDFEVEMNGSIVTNDTLFKNTPIQFLDSSLTGSTWKWYLGDGTSSTLQNPTHTYSTVGNFQISLEVEDTAGCKETHAKSYWIVSGIGVDEGNADRIKIYPNPSSGIFQIDLGNLAGNNVTLDVLDVRGALIQTVQVRSEELIEIDLSRLPSAMYIVRISSEEKILLHQRLFIQ